MTTAEKTLQTIAKVILVLGIIACVVVFITSCLEWDYSPFGGSELEGIRWIGFSSLIYCVMATLTVWSVMTLFVEIFVNIRSKAAGKNDWKSDFAVACLLEDKSKAKEILYKAILASDEYKNLRRYNNEVQIQKALDNLNQIFSPYLKAVDESVFKYLENKDLLDKC